MSLKHASSKILRISPISTPAPMDAQDPFLFAVYHKDHYPAGNDKMEAPRRGNGADFNANSEYRMYHGDTIPGFPQHPHRGFETVTCTIEGIIDHTDSLGCSGRYGDGDLQWMTAGKGIVHGEMFPLLKQGKLGNPTRFFQLWLNLPARSKMVEPNQLMHWGENIKKVTTPDGKVSATVWAGELNGTKALPAIRDSWAADPANDVNIWHITLKPAGTYKLPKSAPGSTRSLFFIEGSGLTIDGDVIPNSSLVVLKDELEVEIGNAETTKDVEVLVLQGKPIGEKVVQQGPFVMNSSEEINQAFSDYRQTKFGGWPWPEDAMVFERKKGRFLSVGGKTEYPPQSDPNNKEKDEL